MCNKLTINLDAKGRKKEERGKIAEETIKGFSFLLFSSVQGMKYGVVESTVNKIVEPLLKIFPFFQPERLRLPGHRLGQDRRQPHPQGRLRRGGNGIHGGRRIRGRPRQRRLLRPRGDAGLSSSHPSGPPAAAILAIQVKYLQQHFLTRSAMASGVYFPFLSPTSRSEAGCRNKSPPKYPSPRELSVEEQGRTFYYTAREE